MEEGEGITKSQTLKSTLLNRMPKPNLPQKKTPMSLFDNIIGFFNSKTYESPKHESEELNSSQLSMKFSDQALRDVHHRDFTVTDFIERPIGTWTHVLQFA